MIIETGALVDIHVHLREPGQTHKETIATGTAAARAGGFGAVACMPNTVPPVDTPEMVRWVIERAAETACCAVYPIAAITMGQKGECLTDFSALKQAGAIALSDDGFPVRDKEIMRRALIQAYKVGLPVISHCEPETEIAIRDIRLADETGTKVHIAHVSLKTTVDAIREAKSRGVRVTAETCPHYIVPWASGKMNPPLMPQEDIDAVLDALVDGTIDCITTDHAPHTQQEKQSENPPNGVTGLETSLGVVLTALYHTGRLSIEDILSKMRNIPAGILNIPLPDGIITIDTDKTWTVGSFVSKASNTPFYGCTLKGTVTGYVG